MLNGNILALALALFIDLLDDIKNIFNETLDKEH